MALTFASVSRALRGTLAALLVTFFAAGSLASCGDDGPVVRAVFDLDAIEGEAFFDMPWPNDLRLNAEGHPRMANYPGNNTAIVRAYLALVEAEIEGFSISAPIYFRFDGPIDAGSLPSNGDASLTTEASVFLLDVDPDSPHYGQRHPIETQFVAEATRYWPGNTVAVRPVFGIPLRDRTRYAAVVTQRVRSEGGGTIQRPTIMDTLLGARPPAAGEEAAVATYAGALPALQEANVALEDIVSLTVFTTQDVTTEMLALRDAVDAMEAPALVRNSTRFVRADPEGGYQLIHGAFESPQFMEGEAPFTTDGGRIRFNDDGTPVAQGNYEARFALTLPTEQEMPENGWPLILYGHGTGGDFESFVGQTAANATEAGFAMMGIDQIHHGPRNPSSAGPEALVFNFVNPQAFRNNNRQSAVDLMAVARFAAANPVDPRAVGPDVFFDPERIYYFGHSQGGLNGPIFMAVDDTVQGGVLSGAGGQIAIALVEKTEPIDIPAVVTLTLGLTPQEAAVEQLNYNHPVFAALAIAVDVADPTHYARLIHDTPREGYAPKHILMTQGLSDAFTPPSSMEALALAARIPILGPVLEPFESGSLVGLSPLEGEAQGNADGTTAALIQYDGGHFVAFREDAPERITHFFESALQGTPVIR